MIPNEHTWVIILAAGEGDRIRSLTRDRWGHPAPKQYSSIAGRTSLLGTTLERAKKIAPVERILAIVASHHRRWWVSELAEIPPENVIVQPVNRGTAAGILLPLVWICRRDPDAVVVLLPSDHHIDREEAMHDAIADTVVGVTGSRVGLALLGVKPEFPESDYGWIVPASGRGGSLRPVASFCEKPDVAAAAALIRRGALLNSFIQVADGRFLLGLFEVALPQLWRSFQPLMNWSRGGVIGHHEMENLYRSVPNLDFSKNLLERAADKLWVYPAPACGWLDLGTPERLVRYLNRRGFESAGDRNQPRDSGQKRGSRNATERRPGILSTINHAGGVMASDRV